MYSVTILCLCFFVFSESSILNRLSRGLSTSEYVTQNSRPATSYTSDSNALGYDGMAAEHRSSLPRTCNCSPHVVCSQVTEYCPPSTTSYSMQWTSTNRRTMPPWPTRRTTSFPCTTCRTLPPCMRCQTLRSWPTYRTSLPPCTTCRILPPCKRCQTLPSWPTHRTSLPPSTTCRTQPPCTTCRTQPPCTTCRTLPPCTTCRTLPPCTTCRTLPPCTTCRTLPPCMKCQTTRPYSVPMLVVRVELPERPRYKLLPCNTPSYRDGGYENAWPDNTPPSAINGHQFTTTRRPCRQPISYYTKCPCTSIITTIQPCNCKLRN